LSVCRLVPRKGIDMVFAALPALLADFPDLRYLIVGDGPDRSRLERLVEDGDLWRCVHFAGQVSSDELPACYRSGHIFVLPTREEKQQPSIEGFGIAFLEASASGLAVVAGRSGGVEEAVIDGVSGILVPPSDPTALTEALLRLLREPELRRHLGQAGRAWVEREMTWERAGGELIDALALADV
jgi:phosphatidylinositol alpha-1,6-mannosyltransferase